MVTRSDGRPGDLRSCLDSLIRSSYRKTEILVVANPVHRATADIVRSYARWDPRIGITKPSAGISGDRRPTSPNGRYLMVVEVTDRLEKGAVARLVKVLRLTASDFAVGSIGDGSANTWGLPAEASGHGEDRLGLTRDASPDGPTLDGMAGKLFRLDFLTGLAWTLDAALSIDERDLMDRAYRSGHFDLLNQPVGWRQRAEVSDSASRSGSATDVTTT